MEAKFGLACVPGIFTFKFCTLGNPSRLLFLLIVLTSQYCSLLIHVSFNFFLLFLTLFFLFWINVSSFPLHATLFTPPPPLPSASSSSSSCSSFPLPLCLAKPLCRVSSISYWLHSNKKTNHDSANS